jgi:hypothetical protein
MLKFARRLLIVVTGLAFLGGATLQIMPVAEAQTMPSSGTTTQTQLPCDPMVAMTQAANPAGGTVPCRGITPDCIKQMGCIGVANLLPAEGLATPIVYAAIIYWPVRQLLDGVAHEPDLLPPIAF